MTTIGSLLGGKTEVFSVGPKDTVFDALILMAEKDVGALMVMDGPDPVGIISERDYARKVGLKEKAPRRTSVEDVMTPLAEMYGVKPSTTLEEAMVLITKKKVRHLPVFDERRIVGLISIGDVLKSTISVKEIEIQQLSNYIAGKYT